MGVRRFLVQVSSQQESPLLGSKQRNPLLRSGPHCSCPKTPQSPSPRDSVLGTKDWSCRDMSSRGMTGDHPWTATKLLAREADSTQAEIVVEQRIFFSISVF